MSPLQKIWVVMRNFHRPSTIRETIENVRTIAILNNFDAPTWKPRKVIGAQTAFTLNIHMAKLESPQR